MTRTTRARTQQYDESSIKRLKGLEGVRMRPTQYLGQRGDFMLFQAIKELWDNALDEFLAKRNKHIFVYADNKNQTYIVADRAQGIPVGLVPSDPKNPKSKKVSTLTLIFTEIHTGGKFDDKAYKTSKGTHGIGASATNAVSLSFEVWTRRENKWYYQKFSKGEPVADIATVRAIPADVKKCLNYDPKQGTIIRCVPDQSIVSIDGGKTKARLSLNFTSSWLKDVAMLNPGIEITFSAQDKIKTFHNKDGLKYLIGKKLEAAEAEADGRLLEYNSESCRVALQWSNYADADRMETYVCSGKTTENGEHEVGFRNALFKAVSEYKKKTDKFAPLDLYYGLIGIFDYHMSGAEYSGQTKNKLVSNVSGEIEKELLPQFKAFFDKNKTLARSIIRRAVEIKKSKEAFKTAVKNAQDAKQRTKASLPPGLVAAPKATAATRELYIVEGDSAAGCHFSYVPVLLSDGSTKTFEELVADHASGLSNEGIAYDIVNDKFVPFEFVEPRVMKEVYEYIEIVFEDGFVWRGTLNHPWLLTTGEYKAASELTPDDEIQEYRRQLNLEDKLDSDT